MIHTVKAKRMRVVEAIRRAHPQVQVATSWTLFGRHCSGIDLTRSDCAGRQTLSAALTDAQIAAMDDASIMAWAAMAIEADKIVALRYSPAV